MSAGTIQGSFVGTNVRTPRGPTSAPVIQDSGWPVMPGTARVITLDKHEWTIDKIDLKGILCKIHDFFSTEQIFLLLTPTF